MCETTVGYCRTAVIKLDTPKGADTSLQKTVEQFKHCANTASEWCWHGRRQIPEESGCQSETHAFLMTTTVTTSPRKPKPNVLCTTSSATKPT